MSNVALGAAASGVCEQRGGRTGANTAQEGMQDRESEQPRTNESLFVRTLRSAYIMILLAVPMRLKKALLWQHSCEKLRRTDRFTAPKQQAI